MILCSLSDHDSSISHSMSFKSQWILDADAIAKLMGNLKKLSFKAFEKALVVMNYDKYPLRCVAAFMTLLYAAATTVFWSITQLMRQE